MSEEFKVGDRVRLIALPRYVKTAEPMPMLRPPDVISLGEEGVILDRRPGGFWGVRFSKGAFLLDSQYLETVESNQHSDPNPPSSSPE
ncbi:regulatory protein SipA [Coleofasciculus sp.]|uniref:regulatory protein SipA n=1 Tax=Coleofasciculus sp. TaxID=3100458 RepID=UPI003A2CC6B8